MTNRISAIHCWLGLVISISLWGCQPPAPKQTNDLEGNNREVELSQDATEPVPPQTLESERDDVTANVDVTENADVTANEPESSNPVSDPTDDSISASPSSSSMPEAESAGDVNGTATPAPSPPQASVASTSELDSPPMSESVKASESAAEAELKTEPETAQAVEQPELPTDDNAAVDAEGSDEIAIAIDETVCGAGGQEAYFKTKRQEIYICKNQTGQLTYIATPKKGNSMFLVAQKVQQGDTTGYIALDEAKTYIVTEKKFQLQENSKVLKSEKVIRRQMPDN